MTQTRLSNTDYQRLLEFRDGLRAFLKWSGDQAEKAGLSPSQHQLLLTVRGHDDPKGPTVSDVASHLLLRHHSAVELIRRCETADLVTRHTDLSDARVVRINLTGTGVRMLESLSELHLDELARLAPRVAPIWTGLREERPV